jgi:hypothetical protein
MSDAAVSKVRRCRVVQVEVPARSRAFSQACDKLRREGVTLEGVVAVRWRGAVVVLCIEDSKSGEFFSPDCPHLGRRYEELRLFVPSARTPVAIFGGDKRCYLSTSGQVADVLRGLASLGTEGQMYEFGSAENGLTGIRWVYGSDQVSSGGGRIPLGWNATSSRYLFVDNQGTVYGLSEDTLIRAPHELLSSGACFRVIGSIVLPKGAVIRRTSLVTVGKVSEVTVELESGPLPVFKTDGNSYLNAPPPPKKDAPSDRLPGGKVLSITSASGGSRRVGAS